MFNNDASIDIAVVHDRASSNSLGTLSILRGNGLGLFQPAINFNGGRPLPIFFNARSIAIGRFDNLSQTDDIVAADGTLRGLSPGGIIYLSAAQGYIPVPSQTFTTISLVADLDGLGERDDIILIEQNLGLVFLMLNVSDISTPEIRIFDIKDIFTNADVIPTSATTFMDPRTGLTNLAITSIVAPDSPQSFGQLIVGINNGAANFEPDQFMQFVATSGATNLLSGDFNNDLADDLVYIDYRSNFVVLALNDGTNFFLEPKIRETGGFIPVSAVVSDLNDDDNLDLAVVNQGAGIDSNQSLISIMIGRGDGDLVTTGSLLQVPNFALSIAGGLASQDTDSVRRIVDFNNDGLPDLAVASTRGGVNNVFGFVPSVTLLLNRIDSPGNFIIQPPIALIDDTVANLASNIQLEGTVGGPGMVSGRGDGLENGNGIVGRGGANFLMSVGDFNADGSTDLVVTGTFFTSSINNFRSSIYLVGNETMGTMRVARPQRSAEYGGTNPFAAGSDTFIGCAVGNFSPQRNNLPDVLHVSINGEIWIDSNITTVLNHAPLVTIKREDLNAPIGGGFKQIITSGESASIPVTGLDSDGDPLEFKLVPTPDGSQPPTFATLEQLSDSEATIIIDAADLNRGPGDLTFRVGVEASDKVAQNGPGRRQPLSGRTYFTLVVKPNSPPEIGPIPNQTIEPGRVVTIKLSISDKEDQEVATSIACDKGDYIRLVDRTLSITPTPSDLGSNRCKITATDRFGLSGSIEFAVTVGLNEPPVIAALLDQRVKAGEVLSVPILVTDPNGISGLRMSIKSGPPFVSLSDNGNGTGTIRIAPSLTDRTGGPVTVEVVDAGGLSAQRTFNIVVEKTVTVNAALFEKQNLFINGTGFGESGAKITINGKDVSRSIVSQTDTSLRLKGSKKKFNLSSGPNQIIVSSEGSTSNIFVFNF
jgi:hypothetical protein